MENQIEKKKKKKIKNGEAVIMGVKGDNVLLAGGERGGRSPPKEVAKRRSYALRLVWTYFTSRSTNYRRNKRNAASQFVRNNSAGRSACKAKRGRSLVQSV
ncbi:MAG: hypothetical protein IKQ90_07665, partial [Ruminococcus sp.]|nr:hypothetical protein [Ruminococcus sp.]